MRTSRPVRLTHRHALARILMPLALLPVLGLSACGGGDDSALTPITVQLKWTHQAQFAGFYAADQNGYYADAGLDVSFLEGGPGVDLGAPVLDGTAEFSITNADALILARAEGDPLRAIATVYRRSPAVYVALTGSGISAPQDFIGKTIAVGIRGIPRLTAITANVGIRPDEYTVVERRGDLTSLYSGEIDVQGAYLTDEVLVAEAAGYELNVIYPDDYGIHFYGDTIFATEDLIAADPDLVARFLRATLKGWTYAVENPDAIGPMVVEYSPEADAALETKEMAASLPLVNTGEDHIGWMKPEAWDGMERVLREQGVLTAPVDVTDVYTLEFLEEIYGSGE